MQRNFLDNCTPKFGSKDWSIDGASCETQVRIRFREEELRESSGNDLGTHLGYQYY